MSMYYTRLLLLRWFVLKRCGSYRSFIGQCFIVEAFIKGSVYSHGGREESHRDFSLPYLT